MIEKLGQREKRALIIGAICAAGILAVALGTDWLDHWRATRESLAEMRAKLELISMDAAKQAGLFSIVPAFEMPRAEQEQELLFRDKLDEQLKKVGIRSEPLQVLPATSRLAGYKLLRVKCIAKCRFGQVLDLLAVLKENPYLVGVEEMRIQGGIGTRPEPGQRPEGQRPGGQPPGGQRPEGQPQQREEVELNLTVSAFAK